MAKDKQTDADQTGTKAGSRNRAKWAATIIVLAAVLTGAWFLYNQLMNGQQKSYVDIAPPPVQFAVTATAASKPVIAPGPMLCWVDLLTAEMKSWRTKAFVEANKACRRVQWNKDRFRKCVSENMPQDLQMRSWSIPLYSAPAGTSMKAGEIRIAASAVDDFSMQFIAQDGTAVPFESDDSKGYDIITAYLQTVLNRQGDWALLPKEPFPTEVWINAAGHSFVYPGGGVYEWNGKDIVIVDMGETGLYVRDTVSTDYPRCGEEEKETPEEQVNKFTIPWSDLFDKNRHLLLKEKDMIC